VLFVAIALQTCRASSLAPFALFVVKITPTHTHTHTNTYALKNQTHTENANENFTRASLKFNWMSFL